MEENNKLQKNLDNTNKELHLSAVNGSLYVSCVKCKKSEDTFEDGEIPNEYWWVYHKKKWYCGPCNRLTP